MKISFQLAIFFCSFLISSCSDLHLGFQDHDPISYVEPVQLNDEVRGLLQQEMRAIQSGMMLLVPAIASGEWDKIVKISEDIQNSYVLKQQLTPEQRQHLHQVLPADFIRRDKAFHKTAGKLARAADREQADIVSFYFYKLSTACAECHSNFAQERFPALVKQQGLVHQQ